MNWVYLKVLVSNMCLAGAVVASWSYTQEVARSNHFNEVFLSLNSANHLGKAPIYWSINVIVAIHTTMKQVCVN